MWNVAGGWQKLINFNVKFCLNFPKENKERKPCQGARETSDFVYSLHFCLSWSLVLTRCCVPTWVKKTLMRAILMFSQAAGSPPLFQGIHFKYYL